MLALGLVLAGAIVFTASAGSASPSLTGGTSVRVSQAVCPAPTRRHASCDAMRLVTEHVSTAAAQMLQADGLARPAALQALSAGPAGGYTPAQLAAAYGLNVAGATTQTVAIVDAYADPSVTADLDAFDSHYGLPAETATSFRVVNQTGTTDLSAVHSDVGWAGEITLDVDTVRGICHACKIVLVEANSNSFLDLATAVNTAAVTMHATIVSNSYGGTEYGGDPNTAAYNHAGVAILASSGDDGWYDWNPFNIGGSSSNAPQIPAAYNSVVGVGGTSLYLNPDGTRAAETVWNENGPYDAAGYSIGNTFGSTAGAAGGGCSALFSAPAWQRYVTGYAGLGCGTTLRSGVDIAADADSFTGYDIYETTSSWCTSGGTDGNGNNCPTSNPGWQTYGGTSLASPLVAAMWGLAGGPAGVTNPSLTLYGHFKSAPAGLYDVTVGGNGACDNTSPLMCSGFFGTANPNTLGSGLLDCQWLSTGTSALANKYQCNARPGYDGPSGVGTPKGVAPFQPISPTAKIVSPGTVDQSVAHVFSASGSTAPFPGDGITSYQWTWGDGTSTTTSSVTTSHTYSTAGTRTITLTVTDGDSALNNHRTGVTSLPIVVHAPQTVAVSRTGTGKGTVTSSPSGISCGATCSHAFNYGTSVKLTATPASGSVFKGWSGACTGTGTCTVAATAKRSVTANFALKTAALHIHTAGTGKGTVRVSRRATSCSSCKRFFAYSTSVKLTAKPAAGSVFTRWSGACTGTGSCTLTMNRRKSVTAHFRRLS